MRYGLTILCALFWSMTPAMAQVSIGIGLPGVSIGINLPLYPELVQVPGYPVYYAPRMDSNYFFYDGMYWVYQSDNWYASSWYNGPWGLVGPEVVPLFVLRIPVRYYRAPPGYFRGWQADAPPRWGDHWGNTWQQRRSGWDRWNRNAVPAPAPLPVYQRQYSGDRYPRADQQPVLRTQNYRYQPRDTVVRQHFQEQAVQKAPVAAQPVQRGAQQERGSNSQDNQRNQQQGGPDPQRSQPPQKGGDDVQRSVPLQAPPQQKGPAAQEQRQQSQQKSAPPERQESRTRQENMPQGKGDAQEERRGQDKGRDKDEERGRDRNK
jgi:hypothetical protein